MHRLVLLLAAVALIGNSCICANIDKHLKILPDIDNNIEPLEENNLINSKHSATKKFVNITNRPRLIVAHMPGDPLELTCEALGAPAPVIHWYKNDAPVYEFDQESNEILDTNPSSLGRVTSTLLVPRVGHHDEYSCIAVSGPYTARATTTVYSTDSASEESTRTKLIPLAPRILVSYKVYLDTIGSTVLLPCRAKGHPKPKITWTWRDNKGLIKKKDPRMKVLRSGELVISSLRWSDLGEYTCTATNAFGSLQATTFVYPAKAG